MLWVTGSMSANTGMAELYRTARAPKPNSASQMTSVPGPAPAQITALWRAHMQLAMATACFAPIARANARSNRGTNVPPMRLESRPEASTSRK